MSSNLGHGIMLILVYGERQDVVVNSSVKMQKGESQNGCYKKTKHVKFSEKRTFCTP